MRSAEPGFIGGHGSAQGFAFPTVEAHGVRLWATANAPQGAVFSVHHADSRGWGILTEADAVVIVVDDEAAVRRSLENLIRSVGLRVEAFASAQEFLRSKRPDVPGCLVLDVRLPGLSGLDLQKRMAEAEIEIPIIFITGHADIAMTVQAMKAGAVEFLTKPFREQDLLDAIQQALERDSQAREQRAEIEGLRRRFALLTPREREVMALMAAGLLNKQIAGELGASETTVKIHRHHVMEKMGADSLADLVRMADKLRTLTPKS